MCEDWSRRCAIAVAEAGYGKLERFIPLPGGRNNRVFRAETTGGVLLFKSYFHHPQDTRQRLRQEFAYLDYLQSVGSAFAARPIWKEEAAHLALMEFIEGRRPELEEISAWHIDQAITFHLEANPVSPSPAAAALPVASEACFSLAQHEAITQRRVDRLDQMCLEEEVDRLAQQFVVTELRPLWLEVVRRLHAAEPSEEARAEELPAEERCLSPSDFGFHNSLLQDGPRLRFVDFEYAGWDDPAKMIADFANQPDTLLPRALSNRFREAIQNAAARPEALARRVKLLEPLYQVKWACICLNDFLSIGRSRHAFTEGERASHRQRREFQLGRARQMLARAVESLNQAT